MSFSPRQHDQTSHPPYGLYPTHSQQEQKSDGPPLSKRSRNRDERAQGPPLPVGYKPTPFDICSGRGKKNWNLEGNVAFRGFIQTKVGEYMSAQTKVEKTNVVVQILQILRSQGFQFLKEGKDGRYYDIGDKEARDKVGHSLRDQVTAIKQKSERNKEGVASLYPPAAAAGSGYLGHQRKPSLTMSDSGNETEMRRSALESTNLFKEFARRPSWIIGEDANSSWDYVDQYMDMDIDSDSATVGKHDSDFGECRDQFNDDEAADTSANHSQLMKNSILSFDDRVSQLAMSSPRISGLSNVRMSAVSNPRMSLFGSGGGNGNGHRRSTLSGRSSLRVETQAELMRLSDFSVASDIFDEQIDWGNHTG